MQEQDDNGALQQRGTSQNGRSPMAHRIGRFQTKVRKTYQQSRRGKPTPYQQNELRSILPVTYSGAKKVTRHRWIFYLVAFVVALFVLHSHATNLSLLGCFDGVEVSTGTIVGLRAGVIDPGDGNTTEEATAGIVDSSMGTLFHGKPFRLYGGSRMFGSNATMFPQQARTPGQPWTPTTPILCEKWAVLTTISEPTEAVRRAAALSDWCTLVIADTKTPGDYMKQARLDQDASSRVFFLSVADQKHWAQHVAHTFVGDLIQATPWRHFARKNLGYLFAIQHGARFIFDFDDDNILDMMQPQSASNDAMGLVVPPLQNYSQLEHVRVPIVGPTIFNHHPLMGASVDSSWARGFPLERLQDIHTHGEIIAFEHETMPLDKIGVLQICAQENPDVDAIHQLTKTVPMNFTATKPLLVPSHVYAPYNAQATVHTHDALFALLLPFTVPRRVSDIWRSYFAQRIFHDVDLSLVFLPPKVLRDRNEHSCLADMKAELDLDFKASALIEFLDSWSSSAMTVPERMESLWIDLYERGYMELDDVKLVQLWLGALVESGYQFPRIRRNRYTNLAIMGQFNTKLPQEQVMFWVQKWRQVSRHVQVRGDFSPEMVQYLAQAGIQCHAGVDNTRYKPLRQTNIWMMTGVFSPIENLAKTLREQQDVTGIDGVLYIHDDGILDMQQVGGRGPIFPSDEIIATSFEGFYRELPYSYVDARHYDDPVLANKLSFRILQDGSYLMPNGTTIQDAGDVIRSLNHKHYDKCVAELRGVALDPRSAPFRDVDGSFIVPALSQADFLFVPMKHADDFVHAADLMVQHHVFLECGIPTIVQMLRHHTSAAANVTVRRIPLCTLWDETRGKISMLDKCQQLKQQPYTMSHPIKMNVNGLLGWDQVFDEITFPST